MPLGNCFLENLDAFGVRQAHELFLDNSLKTLEQSLVDHLVEELKVVLAVVQCPLHAVLYEVFLQIHQVVEVDEGHFGLNHPELCQVARGVGVLCPERGAEGVDGSQCRCAKLALELSAHGERRHLAEEVVVVDDSSLVVFLQAIQVLGCHLEHLACSLCVACCNERRMEVEVAVVVEVFVDGNGHVVAYSHHSTEGVGAQSQVGVLPHVLETLAFLLHGVVVSAGSEELDALSLYLHGLPFALTLHESAACADARAGGDVLQKFCIELRGVHYELDVLDGRAVVEGDEVNSLAAAVGTHPAHHRYLTTKLAALQRINYFCPFHRFIDIACLFRHLMGYIYNKVLHSRPTRRHPF